MRRVNEGGNYCGHVPQCPDFSIRKPVRVGTGGHPRILSKLMERVTEYYVSPRLKIPSLDQANDSVRKQRTERRESCLRLLIAIIKHTDLASMRIGQPTREGFVSYDMKYLSREARLGYRRAERAMRDLILAGLISAGKQPRQRMEDGSYKGLAKPRTVSPLLFGLFGLAEWLKFERKKKSKRLEETARSLSTHKKKVTRTQLTRFKIFSGALADKLGSPTRKKTTLRDTPDFCEEDRRALMILYGELKAAHPRMNATEIKERAAAIMASRALKQA